MVAFSVLAMWPLSFIPVDKLDTWGNDKITTLTKYYGSEAIRNYKPKGSKVAHIYMSEAKINADDTMAEWIKVKGTVLTQEYPRDNMATLWKCIATFHKEQFPNLMKLAALALTSCTHFRC